MTDKVFRELAGAAPITVTSAGTATVDWTMGASYIVNIQTGSNDLTFKLPSVAGPLSMRVVQPGAGAGHIQIIGSGVTVAVPGRGWLPPGLSAGVMPSQGANDVSEYDFYYDGNPTAPVFWLRNVTGPNVPLVTAAMAPSNAFQTLSITAGTAYQNTSLSDQFVSGVIAVTAAAGGSITLGIGATATPTQEPYSPAMVASENVAFCVRVPASSYLLISTTGTITIGSITAVTS